MRRILNRKKQLYKWAYKKRPDTTTLSRIFLTAYRGYSDLYFQDMASLLRSSQSVQSVATHVNH